MVGVPEGPVVGSNEGVRGRSADGRKGEEGGDVSVRPGGWGRRSVSWMGDMGGAV